MKDLVEKWAATVLAGVSLALVAAAGALWNNQRDLLNFVSVQWPLEKRLILLENEQLRNRLTVIEGDLMEAEDRIRELER